MKKKIEKENCEHNALCSDDYYDVSWLWRFRQRRHSTDTRSGRFRSRGSCG